MTGNARRRNDGRRPDYVLVAAVAALLLIGLLMVFSTTLDWSYQETGDPFHHVRRQAQWAGLGIALAIALAILDLEWLRRAAVPLMAGTVLVLTLLLLIGEERLGARRALLEGSVQPGELAKLTMVIYIAAWVSSKGEQVRNLTYGMIPFSLLIGFAAGLVVRQPDYSTAVVIVSSCLAVFFVGGADILQLAIGGVVGGGMFSALVLTKPYARDRLIEYLLMLQDPSQMGYHVKSSLIALGSGGVFGSGIGLGRHKFYVPVPHTDSILAIIGEELGFVGCLLVIALFAIVVWRGMRIARQARGDFGMMLACGLTVLLAAQALINAGVVSGLLPFTGMVLPFISLGGSSLLVSFASVGILLNISQASSRGRRKSARLDRRWRDRGTRLSRAGRAARS
jgi:cell division protein FtsW